MPKSALSNASTHPPRAERPLKVLHVLPWITHGGVEKRRLELIQKLDPARFEQRFLTSRADGAVADALASANIPVTVIDGPWSILNLDAINAVQSYAAEWKPDIIHGAVFEGCVMAALGGYLAGVPHRIIEETAGSPHRSWRGDLLLSGVAAIATHCVGISPYTAQFLQDRSQVPASKVSVIVNGTPFPEELGEDGKRASRARFGIPEDALVIGCLGRMFDSIKRFSDLLAAMTILEHPERPIYLLLGGDGPDLEKLRAKARELGVSERVIFAGFHGDVAPLYACMDIFALASVFEGFGLVLAEAMSVSLPVVATRVGAIPFIVEDGASGLLVPHSSPKALAASLQRLIDAPELRISLGRTGRERARRDFSSERYAGDVERLYTDLMAAT
ncbi:MAG: glycosyltransferase family 4 protein [Myxococcota bacterium]|jgi:glycosyltransferase involved in cell wall biosynthesis|nr:glycosyltransferase family 4 protein [Myxococcota bacterium]